MTETWEDEGGAVGELDEVEPTISESYYLIYCKHHFNSQVALLGPIVKTREEAEKKRQIFIKQGWDAQWVGLGEEGVWIV